MVRSIPQISTLRAQQQTEKRFCATCSHHLTFHQLITRDKWQMFDITDRPTTTHRIPWFCEYIVESLVTDEERVCGCTNLVPVTVEEIGKQ